MTDTLRFVDGIGGASVLDINNGTTYVLQAYPDFSPPRLKESISSSMLRDGDLIAASSYQNRVLNFKLFVNTANAAALATAIENLVRQLDQANNILEWRNKSTSAGNAVFFLTYRSPDIDIEDDPYDDGQAMVTLAVRAAPFAYGARVDVAGVVVASDPASANGRFLDVSGVLGDVPTPAYIETEAGKTDGFVLFATRRHDDPTLVTWYMQCEAMTQGVNTTTQPNNAAYSGAGNNFSRTTFGTPSTQQRLTTIGLGTRPLFGANATLEDAVGTYRVFARVKKSAAGTVGDIKIQFYMEQSGQGQFIGDLISLPAWNALMLVDMGLVRIPFSTYPQQIGVGAGEPPINAIDFSLYAQRDSGALTLDWDYVIFIPADEELTLMNGADPGAAMGTFDGPNDMVWQTSASLFAGGAIWSTTGVWKRAGSLPMLTPNQLNRIFFMSADPNLGGGALVDDITRTVTVTVRYWPAYLYIK